MQPNAEQRDILDAIAEGHQHVAIRALAGTGKSTTVAFAAQQVLAGKSTQYLVFNKKNADEAKVKLPGMKVNTAHSLAWNGAHPDGGKISAIYETRRVDKLYGSLKNWRDPRFLQYLQNLKDLRLNRTTGIFLLQDIINGFCQSADTQVSGIHISDSVLQKIQIKMARLGNEDSMKEAMMEVVGMGDHLFSMMLDKRSDAPVTHDGYLKIWSVGNPRIPVDHILFDEAQDASMPMLQGILKQNDAQLVFIGDTNQSIYGWRGAVDAMLELKNRFSDTKIMPLQSSYRFGQGVADAGNVFLTMLYELENIPTEFRAFLRGVGNYDSRIGDGSRYPDGRRPTAVLFRGNAALLQAAIEGIDRGDKVFMAGDQAQEIAQFLDGCGKLFHNQFTPHPELRYFDDFSELKAFTETREGQGLKFLVNMVIQRRGCMDREIALLRNASNQHNADYVLSTMHRSKGLEFAHVVIHPSALKALENAKDDGEKIRFSDVAPEDLRLLYVAATRAHETLYENGLIRAVQNLDGLPSSVHAAINRLRDYSLGATPRAAWENLQWPAVPDVQFTGSPALDWVPDWQRARSPESPRMATGHYPSPTEKIGL
ncbi:UvrD-helicase domain-containing protein [Acidithiobacillus sp. VAN18-1]|uniref:DNA 3'-5' helicase n=1 Tax=Igneacidithiobacillus copahuensis TaxID=2724909 RepID=A0AAE3CK84_9PROT|nr:UvrD-helicase domain-containing protein [Igneacidithiobacillus copahuensis]MBU2788617.1 UvrD-helicase domain-containing protein [Igneacidithiobacillus copahuensis]MBU2796699.1 UvrD-helicase domain-containing protein [Acidithiobacillus sp. VAN18-2]